MMDYDKMLKLTDDEVASINDIDELLEISHKALAKIDDWPKISTRNQVLLMIFAAGTNHVKSVNLLLGRARTASAEIILRSLFESFVNMKFIFLNEAENAHKYILDADLAVKEQARKMLKYRKKNPHRSDQVGNLTDMRLHEMIHKRQEMIGQYVVKHSLSVKNREGLPSVFKRLVAIDDSGTDSDGDSFQWMYLTAYWLLSEQAHVSYAALKEFVGTNDDNSRVAFMLDGTKGGFDRVSDVTYALYVDMLTIVNANFQVVEEEKMSVLTSTAQAKLDARRKK